MKKIILNISDLLHEKLRFEAIHQRKSITEILSERLLHKPFDPMVEECYETWLEKEIEKIIGN